MSRAEKKLAKMKAEEELRRLKQEKKLKQQQELANAPKSVKIVAGVIVGLLFIGIVSAMVGGGSTDTVTSNESSSVVAEVETALDELGEDMKSSLASTSVGGYQGDIEKVEAYGNDGVKIHVSTHYTESGDEADGGKNIARKIFATICFDVPELSSVYVTSTSSGLDSQSVYRSDIPACNQ